MISADYDGLVAATRATLERIASDFSPAVFASSLAAEDMVLTDLILRAKLPIRIFTLEDDDQVEPPPDNWLMPDIEKIVKAKLGAETRFSARVNGSAGLYW